MKKEPVQFIGARLTALLALPTLLALLCLAAGCDGEPEEPAARRAADESEWRQKYENLVSQNEVVYRQLNVLKSENEELRKDGESLKEQLKGLDELAALKTQLAERTERVELLQQEVAGLREGEKARPEPKPIEPSADLLAAQRGRERLEELGTVLFGRQQYDTARAVILSALQLGSESPRTFFQLGVCEAADGHYDLAAERYEQALEALRKQPDKDDGLMKICLTDYAAARLKLGEPQKAAELCLGAIELDEAYAPAYFNLGLAYAGQPDRRQEAVEAFRKHIVYGGQRSVSARELIIQLQAESAPEVPPEP